MSWFILPRRASITIKNTNKKDFTILWARQSTMGILLVHLCLVLTVARHASCYSKTDEETGAQHLVHALLLARQCQVSILVSVSLLGQPHLRLKVQKRVSSRSFLRPLMCCATPALLSFLFTYERQPWKMPHAPALPRSRCRAFGGWSFLFPPPEPVSVPPFPHCHAQNIYPKETGKCYSPGLCFLLALTNYSIQSVHKTHCSEWKVHSYP